MLAPPSTIAPPLAVPAKYLVPLPESALNPVRFPRKMAVLLVSTLNVLPEPNVAEPKKVAVPPPVITTDPPTIVPLGPATLPALVNDPITLLEPAPKTIVDWVALVSPPLRSVPFPWIYEKLVSGWLLLSKIPPVSATVPPLPETPSANRR